MTPDGINSLFEMAGGMFVLLSVWRLWRDKSVRGVSMTGVGFFAFWGYWNLLYYPSIEQWSSFAGAMGVALANTIWLVQIGWYTHKEKSLHRDSGVDFVDNNHTINPHVDVPTSPLRRRPLAGLRRLFWKV